MPRLGEIRHETTLHLVAYGAVGALIVGLMGMTHAYNRELTHEKDAISRANNWAHQASMRNDDVQQLLMVRDELQAQIDQLLARTPTERIIVQACVEPDPVPVFSRDSQFVGSKRRH